MVRRALAGLLVLALLALSAAPASAWPRPSVGHAGGNDAAAAVDCGGSHDPAAAVAPSGQEPAPSGHHGHGHGPPALACCVALQCPMLLADLRPAPGQPAAPAPGLRVRAAAAVRQPAGLDIAPALPPPRGGA